MAGFTSNIQVLDLARMAENAYGRGVVPQGFTPVDYSALGVSQGNLIHAQVFQQVGTNNFIVSYRGTADLADLVTDFQLARGLPPAAVDQAYDFLIQMRQAIVTQLDVPNPGLATIGHSLGGTEANAAAIRAQSP